MAEEVARLVAIVEANLKGFTKGMEDMNRIADRRFGALEKRMKQSERSFGNFGRSFRNVFAGALSIAGITRFVSTVGDMAGKLQDTSESFGVTTDFLQTLGVLSTRAGVGQDQLNKSLGQFAARLGEAQLKGGPFKKFLDGIGVGTRGTTEEVFNRIADAVKNTSDQTQRAAIVAEAFTARGVRLTSVVQQGADAIKAQQVEFAKLGLILTADTIKKIDDLGDRWGDLKRQFTAIGANALVPLVDELSKPAFIAGVKSFASGMSDVAVAVAKMAPHLPAVVAAAGMFAVTRSPLAAGAAFAVTEAFGERTLAQLEAALAANEAAAAASVAARPAALASIELIKKQIAALKQARHEIASAAGIPFATPTAPADGIDRTGTLATESTTGKTIREREIEIEIDMANKLSREIADIREKRAKDDEQFRADRFNETRDLQNRMDKEVLDGIEDFWERAAGAEEQYWERVIRAGEDAEQMEADRIADRIAAIGDAFEYLGGAALQGGEAFERALAGMAQSLALSGLRNLLEAGLTSLVGGGGFFGNLIGGTGAFGGFRASGGPVSPSRGYIVGEDGPEWFRPNSAGVIIPNAVGASGGGSMVINMPIDARGAQQGVADQIRAVAPAIVAAAVRESGRQFKANWIKTQRNQM